MARFAYSFSLACCPAIILVCACSAPAPVTQTGFTVKVKNETSRHEIFSVFLLPEEETEIEVLQSEVECTANAEAGTLRAIGRNHWSFRAPATSGDFVVQINAPSTSKRMPLNVFVMVPFTKIKDEYLQGYRIGTYPNKPLRGQSAYATPAGFIKVTESNQDILLTPHFQLKQFLCKQESAYPKFVALHERLLLALEFILQKVQAEGYKVNTFGFISGYRTPYYNATIENTPNSRHVYGDAADIFIDANLDGKMDDLNRDGAINERDVRLFFDLVDELSEAEEFKPFTGGLGLYKRTAAHEGFVHVDTRGAKTRW